MKTNKAINDRLFWAMRDNLQCFFYAWQRKEIERARQTLAEFEAQRGEYQWDDEMRANAMRRTVKLIEAMTWEAWIERENDLLARIAVEEAA